MLSMLVYRCFVFQRWSELQQHMPEQRKKWFNDNYYKVNIHCLFNAAIWQGIAGLKIAQIMEEWYKARSK